MDFGFSTPTRGPLAAPQHVVTIVRKAEELGFAYVAVPDHVIIPREFAPNYPYSTDGDFGEGKDGDCLEQISLIAFLAGATSTLRFVTSVMVVPHRNPILTAKMLATIDIMSGGRITVGCGAGWLAEEIEALNTAPFAERGHLTDEYIGVFRELWTADNPSFDGAYARFSNIIFSPKPVQKPHPPIWTGGESGPALRRAARIADGWYPIGLNPRFPLDTPDRYASKLAELKSLAEAAGRDPDAIELSLFSIWYDENAEEALPEGGRRALTGSRDAILDDVNRYAELGVRHLTVNLRAATIDGMVERVERFAADVIAHAPS
jgi:probable F420-dependent oxidoreductase